jgi:hypothetical protein
MKGRDCVKFIGQLVLSSFPDGYFLQKNNSFKAASSSDQMDKLFGNLTDFFFFPFFYAISQCICLYFVTAIVSNKYKQKIQRRGHLPKRVTKEEMTKIMSKKIGHYRSKNRKMIN